MMRSCTAHTSDDTIIGWINLERERKARKQFNFEFDSIYLMMRAKYKTSFMTSNKRFIEQRVTWRLNLSFDLSDLWDAYCLVKAIQKTNRWEVNIQLFNHS